MDEVQTGNVAEIIRIFAAPDGIDDASDSLCHALSMCRGLSMECIKYLIKVAQQFYPDIDADRVIQCYFKELDKILEYDGLKD